MSSLGHKDHSTHRLGPRAQQLDTQCELERATVFSIKPNGHLGLGHISYIWVERRELPPCSGVHATMAMTMAEATYAQSIT